ncbi:MAG: hypothetical protein EXR82_04435 [Gammaproteobacteria bacterium]|nr:hypothetical protein [Gammaproteobacteria bacterium]
MLWAIFVVVVVGLVLVYGVKDLPVLLAGLWCMFDELWKKRNALEKTIILAGAVVVWPVGLIGLVLWLFGRHYMRQAELEMDRMFGQPSSKREAPQTSVGEPTAPDPAPVSVRSMQGVEGREHE